MIIDKPRRKSELSQSRDRLAALRRDRERRIAQIACRTQPPQAIN
jgi:hypothetical protein